MTFLRTKPRYDHSYAAAPPKTTLTPMQDKALQVYRKLKPFLAIQEYLLCPAEGWDQRQRRDLFQPNGFHFRVEWRPNLTKGWRRLKFDEFCVWYGILKEAS